MPGPTSVPVEAVPGAVASISFAVPPSRGQGAKARQHYIMLPYNIMLNTQNAQTVTFFHTKTKTRKHANGDLF